MRTDLRRQLLGAKRCSTLVRIERTLEEGWVHGYVIDVGSEFFLMLIVENGVRYNGFGAFRIRDIKRLSVPEPHASFAEAALRLRGLRRPAKPRVTVSSLRDLLRSASRRFPLITIYRERIEPDACWIGQLVDVNPRQLSLLEITPDATWEETPSIYKCREITRVDFAGEYEEALLLVGGRAPAISPSKRPRRAVRKRQRRTRR